MTDASHAPFPALRFYDEWRHQIHDALYYYARTYITRDAWTNMEETMNEIFASSLHMVPEYESTSFHRPMNPLTDFMSRNQFNAPAQYEETFKTAQDVRNLLCDRLQLPNARSKPTELCWIEEDSRPTYLDLCPMTPILSAGSRKETQLLNRPRKPETNATDTTVSLKSLLTGHLGLEPPSISEEPLVSEKILSAQLYLPRQILKDAMSLLQPNPWFSAVPSDLNITNKEYISKPTSEFLRHTSPLPAAFDPKVRMSPPIFSTRIKENPREYLTRDDVHDMLAHATIDDDVDMDTENMAIASGGWSIAPVGWSSTPPLKPDSSIIADDDVCELDELKVPMTPITNKRLKLLIENKMEDIELPKRERFRGRAKGKQVASGAPDLKSALYGLVLPAPIPKASPLEKLPALTRDTESTHGQPPTESPEDQPTLRTLIPFDASVSNMLDAFCTGIGTNDSNKIILDERIDDLDSVLMPKLLHPSIHEPILPGVPTKVADLLTETLIDDRMSDILSLVLVVPAKDWKSLNIELNWRPFVYTGLPITHESLCRVDQPSLLRTVNETGKVPLLSEREVAHVESRLRWPDLSGQLPSQIALKNAFEVKKLYHGGLSIDYPFDGDTILLIPRVSQQGPSSKTSDSNPLQFSPMDLDEGRSEPGPEDRVGDVLGDAFQTRVLSLRTGDAPLVRAGTVPPAPIWINCPSRQDLSLATSYPEPEMDPSVNQFNGPKAELWNVGGGYDLSARSPEKSLKCSLADFLVLRGCPVGTAQTPSAPSTVVASECENLSGNYSHKSHVKDDWHMVLELVSQGIILPLTWCKPSEEHHYLGSLDVIQRLGLVEHLRSHCGVHLVEAETLYGPHIILDSHSCTIFHSMASLAGTNADICKSVTDLAKSFSRILIVLEAFPSSKANYSAEPCQPYILNILSSTVLQAFQKLVNKIKMAISMLDEADGAFVKVEIVAARNVLEVARYVRVYGDACEANEERCFRGLLWGSRSWLQTEDVNELDIGGWAGMNTFASRLIASKMSLLDFIDLPLEDKLASFGLLVGSERMANFHNACCARAAELSLPPSSEPLSCGSTEPE